MGNNVFCTSLAGEELGRLLTWGTHPQRKADYTLASPTTICDVPQNLLEPILVEQRRPSRGTTRHVQLGISVASTQDADGVTVDGEGLRLRPRLQDPRQISSSAPTAAAPRWPQDIGLPMEGKMGVAGSMNIVFEADLSQYVAHRPSVLYWVMQPGADVGGIGMGLVRMVRPWNEWLIVWGYDINEPPPAGDRRDGDRDRPQPDRRPRRPDQDQGDLGLDRQQHVRAGRTRAAGCSAWATPCIAIRRPTGSAPTPRSRMPTISPGSSPMC